MDIQSIRMLLGWSKEELAKQSGVAFASVYLIERMGTAGPKDDRLIIRALLEAHRRKPRKLLLGNDAVLLEHANDDAAIMPASEGRDSPDRTDGQPMTVPCGDMEPRNDLPNALPRGQATSSLKHELNYVDGLSRR